MTLTPEQIADFKRNGFLLLRHFATPQMCDEIRELASKHLYEKIEPIESEEEYLQKESHDRTTRRLRQVYDRAPLFREWMRAEKMRPILAQLLEEAPVLLLAHHNSIMTKLPHKSTVTSWHQDIRYWNYEDDNLVSVWLALGDEYLENGLLEFIPGSHKMAFTPDQFDARITFRDDLPQNQTIIQARQHFELQKGDVVLFHAKVLHYADKNESDAPKISFVYSVKGASNPAIKGTRSDAKEVTL